MASDLVFASRPFEYGPVALDPGQVTEFKTGAGFQNSYRLLDLGYLRKVEGGASLTQCRKCGAKFTTDALLGMHGRKRHRNLTEEQAEALSEREEKVIAETMPLQLDKTSASKGVKRGRGRRASA